MYISQIRQPSGVLKRDTLIKFWQHNNIGVEEGVTGARNRPPTPNILVRGAQICLSPLNDLVEFATFRAYKYSSQMPLFKLKFYWKTDSFQGRSPLDPKINLRSYGFSYVAQHSMASRSPLCPPNLADLPMLISKDWELLPLENLVDCHRDFLREFVCLTRGIQTKISALVSINVYLRLLKLI